jgi:hypothetical protein
LPKETEAAIPVTCARKPNIPIIARSESHSTRVGIMAFVFVAIILIDESVTGKNLTAIIAYPTEAIRTQIVEKETTACMGCARLPMARIDVTAMAR